jgi:hypothetical protein
MAQVCFDNEKAFLNGVHYFPQVKANFGVALSDLVGRYPELELVSMASRSNKHIQPKTSVKQRVMATGRYLVAFGSSRKDSQMG